MTFASRLSASVYAAFSTSSAKESISPCRSTIATRGRWRTCASRVFAGMIFSFQVHYQFEGMVRFVVADAHLVYHIFDQEQSPSTWCLQLCQLGLNIWYFNFRVCGECSCASMISNTYRKSRP